MIIINYHQIITALTTIISYRIQMVAEQSELKKKSDLQNVYFTIMK